MSPSKLANHLIHEKSPYLLQHAYNPVHWYAWKEETFKKAQQEDKPIFLSIGYSTCHWCHVMEHESFEDPDIAKYLNDHFISIKVDREERPDVDTVYMQVCQALTGQGGWPLTIFMTPHQKPFYAGTYFPKESRYGRPGFMEVLKTIQFNWHQHREKVDDITQQIQAHFDELSEENRDHEKLSFSLIDRAIAQLKNTYDEENGGFGEAPKFPTPHKLMFLLRYYQYSNDNTALEMVTKTLDQMYKGGIFDHLGYGFSRYSTDEYWLVPHFEKMLYDNALLILVYTEAYQVTQESRYLTIATQTMKYVLHSLKHKEGGFYCAEDADSEGEEGKFYVFTPEEIISILGQEAGSQFNDFYGVTAHGNFEGKTILNRLHANLLQEEPKQLKKWRQDLLEYRQKRTSLHKDDKILTSWNGLILAALSKLYAVTQDQTYLTAANQTVQFIKEHLFENNRLLARYREGESQFKGYLDDYANLSYGLIELYQATADAEVLDFATTLTKQMITLFKSESGGYFLTGHDAEELLMRPKELYDGAMPSGNSMAAYNLIRLAKLTADPQFETEATSQLEFMAGQIQPAEMNYTFYLIATLFALSNSKELMITLPNTKELSEILHVLHQGANFNLTIMVKTHENEKILAQIAPYTLEYPIQTSAQYYLCTNGACQAPISSLSTLISII